MSYSWDKVNVYISDFFVARLQCKIRKSLITFYYVVRKHFFRTPLICGTCCCFVMMYRAFDRTFSENPFVRTVQPGDLLLEMKKAQMNSFPHHLSLAVSYIMLNQYWTDFILVPLRKFIMEQKRTTNYLYMFLNIRKCTSRFILNMNCVRLVFSISSLLQ